MEQKMYRDRSPVTFRCMLGAYELLKLNASLLYL